MITIISWIVFLISAAWVFVVMEVWFTSYALLSNKVKVSNTVSGVILPFVLFLASGIYLFGIW